jgi:pyrimidine-nucleoside phosphorylase
LNFLKIIEKKRDGKKLKEDEIKFFVTNVAQNRIPDYQISAFLMASFINGLSKDETFYLTKWMIETGKKIDLSDIKGPKIDKHSTGGVGDKISIILLPIVSNFEIKIPMIAGRALGHTGGTIDKLESIDGFKTNLKIKDFKRIIKKVGFSIISQTQEIAPCDKILYSLRDATATIESIPLITASIMSKKLSEGIEGLVLDVKVGKGAFMKERERAEELAEEMVWIGKKFKVKTIAILTNMNSPLGRYVGNSLEIYESIKFLEGEDIDDLKEITFSLGSYMLLISKKAKNFEEGYKMMEKEWKEGKGILKLKEFVKEQGGDVSIFENPEKLKEASYYEYIKSEKDGYVEEIDAYKIGICARELGAGRFKKEDKIIKNAGIIIYKKEGEKVNKGDIILRIQTEDKQKLLNAYEIAKNSFKIGGKIKKKKLILEKI